MANVDWDKQKRAFQSVLKNYGTRTKGEKYRLEQIGDKITEMVMALVDADEKLRDAGTELECVMFYVTF